jgi:hypothetical protein
MPSASPPPGYQPTRLETDDDIREALQARRDGRAAETPLYRPAQRPPLALLCVLDDGGDDGEWVRVRTDRFVVGRTEGDLRVPHDALMSARHAELTRAGGDGGPLWLLADLDSTNGTFVRVGSAVLKSGQEFIVGRSRYRFDAGAADAPGAPPAGGGATRSWHADRELAGLPTLTELAPTGDGPRLPLTRAEYWVGRDAQACAVVPRGDPYVCPRHARLYRGDKGRWHVANFRSVNGVWLRVERMPLDRGCQFLLGEQRFLLRVP